MVDAFATETQDPFAMPASVLTHCGAMSDIWKKEPAGHGYQPDNVTAAASGLEAGTDLDCDTFDRNHVYSKHAALARVK